MVSAPDAPKPPRTVLLIGADPEIARVVAETFLYPEWKIERAPTNEAALEHVAKTICELIVTGKETGTQADVELVRRIRRLHPHTRVIIVAPESTPNEIIAAMRASAFSIFTKPGNPDRIRGMLNAAMSVPPWDDGIELVSASPEWLHLYARCDTTTANRLVQFLDEIGQELPEQERQSLMTAFREMLLNAIEYGGHFNPSEYVEISYLRSSRAVSCRIRDPGEGFSPDEVPHAAISNPPGRPLQHMTHRTESGMRPGGFGVLMARRLVDELIYSDTGNEVVMIKYLDIDSPLQMMATETSSIQ